MLTPTHNPPHPTHTPTRSKPHPKHPPTHRTPTHSPPDPTHTPTHGTPDPTHTPTHGTPHPTHAGDREKFVHTLRLDQTFSRERAKTLIYLAPGIIMMHLAEPSATLVKESEVGRAGLEPATKGL